MEIPPLLSWPHAKPSHTTAHLPACERCFQWDPFKRAAVARRFTVVIFAYCKAKHRCELTAKSCVTDDLGREER